MPKKTKVINIRSGDHYDFYVGRADRFKRLKGSPFGNPYKAGVDGDIREVLQKYHQHLLSRPDLMAEIPSLKGKVLACWCKTGEEPDVPCHADILAAMADGRLVMFPVP